MSLHHEKIVQPELHEVQPVGARGRHPSRQAATHTFVQVGSTNERGKGEQARPAPHTPLTLSVSARVRRFTEHRLRETRSPAPAPEAPGAREPLGGQPLHGCTGGSWKAFPEEGCAVPPTLPLHLQGGRVSRQSPQQTAGRREGLKSWGWGSQVCRRGSRSRAAEGEAREQGLGLGLPGGGALGAGPQSAPSRGLCPCLVLPCTQWGLGMYFPPAHTVLSLPLTCSHVRFQPRCVASRTPLDFSSHTTPGGHLSPLPGPLPPSLG